MQTAPGTWASSNWSSVRTSTTTAPSSCACRTCRGVSGWASTVSLTSGPRLSATMFSKLGRLRSQGRGRLLHEPLLVAELQQGLVLPLEADRRGDLEVHARAATEGAAEVPRPHLAGGGQREQLLLQRAEDAARALLLLDREVRSCDIADEQAVAGEDGPRLVAAAGVDQRQCGVLGTMSRRVDGAHGQRAELELPAVVDRVVVVARLGVAVDVDAAPVAATRRP